MAEPFDNFEWLFRFHQAGLMTNQPMTNQRAAGTLSVELPCWSVLAEVLAAKRVKT